MASSPQFPAPTAVHFMLLDFESVTAGVSLTVLTEFLSASGLQVRDLYDIVIPARTLKHRRQKTQDLTTDESDKLARVVRVFDHAIRVFGDLQAGRAWMTAPKTRFQGATPLQMLATEVGGRAVEEMLWQIDEGMFG